MKKLILALFIFGICGNAFGAVAHVESFYSTSAPNSSGTTTYELTISASTNGILLVTAQAIGEGSVAINTITWNGDSMTKLTTATDTWYLLNPDAGTHNLVLDQAANTYNMYAVTTLYSGVDQNAPEVDAKNSGTTGDSYSETVSDTITTISANSMVYAVGNNHNTKKYNNNGFTVRSPSGLANNTWTSNRLLMMDVVKTTAGDQTFSYIVFDISRGWEIDLVALKPAETASRNRQIIIE